jgi:hypothetical protein
LAIWKLRRLLDHPFRYRTQCHLECQSVSVVAGQQAVTSLPTVDIKASIGRCAFAAGVTQVYYPASKLFKAAVMEGAEADAPQDDAPEADQE